jgi:hypothetical protein
MLRAAPGTDISVTNPVFRDLASDCARASTGPAKAVALASSPRIHATCSAGCESVELVEGPVVEELQAEKVSLPLEEGGVVLGEGVTVAAPAAAPDGETARDGSTAAETAEAQEQASKPKKGRAKKRRHKAEWVSVMEAVPPDGQLRAGGSLFEGVSRCTSTTSFYTVAEPNGCQEAEGTPAAAAPSDAVSGLADLRPSAEVCSPI